VSEQTRDATEVGVPLSVRVMLARPAIQVIADAVGADLLHIKGDAVDRRLRPEPAPGTDVDALVRPAHVPRLDSALRAHGWSVYSTFTYGSPFEHAQTYKHSTWGYFDLHRLFPGIRLEPSAAFDLMWSTREALQMPGARGSVPALEMQATLLVLNAARGGRVHGEALRQWVDEPGLDRSRIEGCVEALHAHVAFAAASGELDRYRGAPDYLLWRVITRGGSRAAEWRARVRAARSIPEALGIAARAPLVNMERLEHDLGRRPSRAEVAAAFFARPRRAVRELVHRARGRR
jgi:hypothetical protein